MTPGERIAWENDAVDAYCETCGGLRPCDCDDQLGAEVYGDDDQEPGCSDPGGHVYVVVDDGSRDGRSLCMHCAADGDA